ncbi:hypothetical protein OC835_003838 [Tilletia horrida]|nr:hypothetical protein OC835_003838 [Tilletia horrida]KAK0561607.1 hypothetical protein OC844_003130 [Tilletia horrida]
MPPHLPAPAPAHPDPATALSLVLPAQTLHRLTHTRRKQLLKAASRAPSDPPPPPGLNECCGSSCDPCVKTLWREELSVFEVRWGKEALELAKQSRVEVEVEVEGEGREDAAGAKGPAAGTEPVSQDKSDRDASLRIAMPGAWIEW